MKNEYIENAIRLLQEIEVKEEENITKAAQLVADAIMNDGIMIAFGSGHSVVGAKEIVSRAGGLFAAKQIKDPSDGAFEQLEGSGKALIKRVEIKPEDVLVLISNSGRNPASIEMAIEAKRIGAKIIVVTALEASKQLTSRHSSGKLLYEFADAILDLHSVVGDAAIEVEGVQGKICGTSTLATVALLQSMILYAVKIMVSKGYNPPVRVSANVDYAPANRSLEIEKKYANRIYRI
ncbi:MAG: SIS domain-containing protein [Erysipelotrichaceae bacterium]|nr:SIS domain-containing protein [Erysipelotrichaceae bacterium]MDD3923958.1 SIS domain-containing protein [Erysipelotrichaceae bacterium]MDD4642222.1 SIS domain-containing protein [Erysipelotrichaceae bacterium]